MFILENDQLEVKLKTKGAELDSIYSKKTKLEYLWSGDAAFWGKKSPVLFPIVGTLKGNIYFHHSQTYQLNRHGFARDMEFQPGSLSATSLTMTLLSNENTLAVYPFPFRLEIIYTLEQNQLHVLYRITNTGKEDMYFSIGGHPAFRLPLEDHLSYEDYYISFEQTEIANRWLISNDGLIEPFPITYIVNDSKLTLTKDLFRKDAIIFKYLNSDKVTLKSDNSDHGLEFTFPHFPYLALWAAPNADFICIEPWCGIADSTTSNQQLMYKEGINLLAPELSFERKWSVGVF